MTPSVTQIISQVGHYWLNFDHVPADRLEIAKERGQEYHSLAALYAKKLWIDEIPDSCAGFFQSFCRWFGSSVEEVILVEQRLVHPIWGYEGTPDLICRMKGDQALILIDHKTPLAFSKSWRLQISAYRELAVRNGYEVERVASLQPNPNGGQAKFKENTESLSPDFAVFLSMLNVWGFFNG